MLKERIGVIGAGKIGSAIMRGVIRAGLAAREQVMASDVSEAFRQSLAAELGVEMTSDNGRVCDFADVVILAVKPQTVDAVVKEIAKKVGKTKLVVSVAAGVPLSRLEANLLPGARVVRVMPNIACVVGAGAAGYAAGAHATPKDVEIVGAILNSFGVGFEVEERYLDAITGLSGSGPAYVFLFVEALADGGVQVGLPRDVALKLALQTVYGAARMALESTKHVAELKDEVTSPGGTTIAGLYALEKGGFRGTVMEAVLRATRRSQELGRSQG
ncbi:MAG TPA: pyrroline-5-carboxylate reductase [Candidatus Acidoferrales bacterium]|nr:pyrroline-5-carboxylate reductase [Candidatus Acidoferrales bacterium]